MDTEKFLLAQQEAADTFWYLYGTPCQYETCGHNVEDGREIDIIRFFRGHPDGARPENIQTAGYPYNRV